MSMFATTVKPRCTIKINYGEVTGKFDVWIIGLLSSLLNVDFQWLAGMGERCYSTGTGLVFKAFSSLIAFPYGSVW